jgi:acyl carrier protein
VREAVVIAREDVAGDKRLVAYLVPHAGAQPGDDALRDYLREKVPEYMVPSAFVSLDRFPLTPNAKVDRKALPAPERVRRKRRASAFKPPENELQERIVEVWREALRLDEVGLDDSFFDLGGHSLLAVQVHRRLREVVDRPLSITDLFRLPTIRSLSEFLSGEDQGDQIAEKSRGATRREALARRRQRRGRR